MQIIDNEYLNEQPLYPFDKFCKKENVLYIDIETTGLSKEKTSLYLIGCGYYKENSFCTKLFFGDDPCEELLLLNNFIEFSKNFTHLVHFNGTKFDIPYLEYKANKYQLGDIFNHFTQVDVYQLSKPLRYLLFPSSMRQKCIEDFLNITREDKYNGGELINVYHSYVASHLDEDFNKLITHNLEDVLGMHKIMPILYYLELKDLDMEYIGRQIHEYKDYEGNTNKELILKYKANINIPKSFLAKTNTLYIKVDSTEKTLTYRLPIYSCEMKIFFENYRDYYYFIDEDTCIHKSVAMGLSKDKYRKVTKDSCYQKVSGEFIKQPRSIFTPSFKSEYKDKANYFLLSDDLPNDKLTLLGKELLNVFFQKRNPHSI